MKISRGVMKVAIVGSGSPGLAAKIALALLDHGICLESRCDDPVGPVVFEAYPDIECRSLKIEQRDDGRNSWVETRRRHNSKR